MVKTREELRKTSKARRTRLNASNKGLKTTKAWYPTTDVKPHFTRKSKAPRPARLRKDIAPGQVLILLSGRFRGRRVIFLKHLKSGLLLVTGPYKLNGVPLKRVNQAYVIVTRTRATLDVLPNAANLTDEMFASKVAVKRGTKASEFFEEPKKKKERITEERRTAQNTVDTVILKAVRATPHFKEYLQNRFALKQGDKPHLMQF